MDPDKGGEMHQTVDNSLSALGAYENNVFIMWQTILSPIFKLKRYRCACTQTLLQGTGFHAQSRVTVPVPANTFGIKTMSRQVFWKPRDL